MNRRAWLATALGSFSLGQSARAADQERDRFGGWKRKKFRPSGYFRLEQDGRWWLVTPEGHAFLSFGVNHIHSGWFKSSYNGEYWAKRLGVDGPRSPEFNRQLREEMRKLLPELGFNTLGVHTDLPAMNTPEPFLPYVAAFVPIDIPHWKEPAAEEFHDVFDPAFAAHAERVAKAVARPDDPFLLGYAMTDCPIFTDWDAKERGDTVYGAPRKKLPTFPRKFRNLGGDQAGKKEYVKTVRELYRGSIESFNAAYETKFASFDGLASAVDWRPDTELANGFEARDNTVFLRKVVDRYYEVSRDALRRQDPNHLFFGDKLNGNSDGADTLVDVTAKYTDLIFYQAYGRYGWTEPSLDRWARKTGKPIFNGDSSFGVSSPHMPRPYGPLAEDAEERAAWTSEFAEKAFARRDFVGWSYCGLIDTWTALSDQKQLRQHAGLMSPTGEWHETMRQAVTQIGARLYELGSAG